MNQRVYRFFCDEEGFSRYAKGSWRGFGIQGDPELGPELDRHLLLKVRLGQISLRLARARTRKPGLIARSLEKAFSRPATGSHKIINKNEAEFRFPLDSKESEEEGEMDLLELEDENWKLNIQALNEAKMHVTIYQNNPGPTLYFAGALTKR